MKNKKGQNSGMIHPFLPRNRSARNPARLSLPLIPRSRSGQIQLSFGMIFSIILIIIFLGFGFYAIKKIVDLQKTVQIEKFLQDFQEDINKMWKSPQGSSVKSYSLPTKIRSVCFEDDEFQNLAFTSEEIIRGDKIENINIEKITADEDPFCIPNIKGKISLTIVKDYGETLVRITK